MNKVKFNEGGMPIVLDDLQLIQRNSFAQMTILLDAIASNTPAFLLKDTFNSTRKVGKEHYEIPSGTLYYQGEFLPFDTLITDDMGETLYICVKTTQSDEREMADGQSRACRENRTAYISLNNTGAETAFELRELPTFAKVLADFLKADQRDWQDLIVKFKNGYSGKVQYLELPNTTDILLRVHITSNATTWDSDQGTGDWGDLFEIDRYHFAVGLLPEQFSFTFSINEDKYNFICEGGNVFIYTKERHIPAPNKLKISINERKISFQ